MSADPKKMSVSVSFPHSERIFKAAEKYGLPIEQVVCAGLSQVDWDEVCEIEKEIEDLLITQ